MRLRNSYFQLVALHQNSPILAWLFLQLIKTNCQTIPLLKGEAHPGNMPGLLQELGTSYWIPSACRSLEERDLSDSKFGRRDEKGLLKNRKRKNKRPAGWKDGGSIKLGEKILAASFQFLNNTAELNYCPFLTRQCCESGDFYRSIKVKHRFTQTFELQSNKELTENCSEYPALNKGDLGTCAFVAQGSSLLRVPRGREIDMHSTVIRFGHMPLKSFESFTGKKTDALYGRGSIQTKYSGDYFNVRYLIGSDRSDDRSAQRMNSANRIRILGGFRKKPQEIVLINGKKFFAGDERVPQILYHFMTSPISGKPRGPSSGFSSLMKVMLSGLCKTVDVYGLSPNCGGYYHNRNVLMKIHHSCELESWALHHIMRNYYEDFHLCVSI